MPPFQTLTLVEHQKCQFPSDTLTLAQGEHLWQQFDKKAGKLQITFPSPKTNHMWEITPGGWIGTIPVSPNLHISIQPKISIYNVFRMWEYAYQMRDYFLFDDVTGVNSVPEFFDHLAIQLALLIRRRARLGIHRAYVPRLSETAYVRGKLVHSFRQPMITATLPCQFDEHSANISDNQIIFYTLDQIARSGICRMETQQRIRQAHHLLASMVTYRPFTAQDCLNRSYSRLNEDYRPIHALCRFFLEQLGPAHHQGTYETRPFLLNMPTLFERFVAAWLQQHLPAPWHVTVQESVHLGENKELRFDIDLVLYRGHKPHAVLDTKYKPGTQTAPADIHQILAYAQVKQTPHAVLIYPTQPDTPLQIKFEQTTLKTVSFSLANDLQQAGGALLNELL